MAEWISPRQLHEAAGVEDWRVVCGGACAHVRAGWFSADAALVDGIGRLADAANHHPDVDSAARERDVELVRQSSAAARKLDGPADPTAVQPVQVTIDALVGSEVMPFRPAGRRDRQDRSQSRLSRVGKVDSARQGTFPGIFGSRSPSCAG